MDRAERTIRPFEGLDATNHPVEREDSLDRNLPVGLVVDTAIQQGLHVGQRPERLYWRFELSFTYGLHLFPADQFLRFEQIFQLAPCLPPRCPLIS
jgi:hypothetical protein